MNPGKWKVNLNHCIFMLYKSAETCHPVSLPCKGTNIHIFVTCGVSFYLWVWSVQPPIQSLYPWVRCYYMQECSVHLLMSFIPMCAINFYIQERFFILTDTTSILMFVMYLHARMLCTLAPYVFYYRGCNKFLHARTFFTLADTTFIQMFVRLLFPWVQCQSLKPVLSQCSQNCFVTVDDFILCTLTHLSSIPMGAINFYMQEHFLHSLIRSHQFLLF